MAIERKYTDQELVMLMKHGDHTAFGEIYNSYWSKMLAIAYNHTRDKSAAQEIVQELFVGVWNRREQLEVGNLQHYLATAVKFSVYKQIERERRRREIEQRVFGSTQPEEEPEKIEARFLQEYISGQVEQLPEKCRMVFNYSRVQHLSIPEIAEKMGISEKTVEGHLTKGLKTLKVNLKDSGILILLASTKVDDWIN